jgi:hypothetical protein
MPGLPEDLRLERERRLRDARNFSFDIDKLRREIDAGDMLGKVIRGHLYLEHVLIQTLQDAFAAPGEIELRRLNFPSKLDLCVALGLLQPEWRRPVLKVNEMRNRMAHRLDTEFTDKDRQDLFDALPDGKFKEMCRDDASWENLFKGIPVWFDISRQNAQSERIHTNVAETHLKRLLDETKGRRG